MINYNAQHSPVGAFASFTLGFHGQKGGLGLEIGGPADENIYIGMESRRGGVYEALPFFAGSEDDSRRYDVGADGQQDQVAVRAFSKKAIAREMSACCDTWKAGDLAFTVYSPAKSVPEPGVGSKAALLRALEAP